MRCGPLRPWQNRYRASLPTAYADRRAACPELAQVVGDGRTAPDRRDDLRSLAHLEAVPRTQGRVSAFGSERFWYSDRLRPDPHQTAMTAISAVRRTNQGVRCTCSGQLRVKSAMSRPNEVSFTQKAAVRRSPLRAMCGTYGCRSMPVAQQYRDPFKLGLLQPRSRQPGSHRLRAIALALSCNVRRQSGSVVGTRSRPAD